MKTEATAFPVTARLNIKLGQEVGRVIGKIMQLDAGTKRNVIAGLYGTVTPRDGGKPTHGVGLSFSLNELTTPKKAAIPGVLLPYGDPPDLNYWKPRYTVYGEVSQPFGTGKSKAKGGAAVTFIWP